MWRSLRHAELSAQAAAPRAKVASQDIPGATVRLKELTATTQREAGLEELSGLRSQKRAGHDLPTELRQAFEAATGLSLGDVRVHTDTEAGNVAKLLGARALAAGQDIYFAPGQFETCTRSGWELLAHELAHTVQEDTTSVHNNWGLMLGSSTAREERQADDVADLVGQRFSLRSLDSAQASTPETRQSHSIFSTLGSSRREHLTSSAPASSPSPSATATVRLKETCETEKAPKPVVRETPYRGSNVRFPGWNERHKRSLEKNAQMRIEDGVARRIYVGKDLVLEATREPLLQRDPTAILPQKLIRFDKVIFEGDLDDPLYVGVWEDLMGRRLTAILKPDKTQDGPYRDFRVMTQRDLSMQPGTKNNAAILKAYLAAFPADFDAQDTFDVGEQAQLCNRRVIEEVPREIKRLMGKRKDSDAALWDHIQILDKRFGRRVAPWMDAAFVNLSSGKNGFSLETSPELSGWLEEERIKAQVNRYVLFDKYTGMKIATSPKLKGYVGGLKKFLGKEEAQLNFRFLNATKATVEGEGVARALYELVHSDTGRQYTQCLSATEKKSLLTQLQDTIDLSPVAHEDGRNRIGSSLFESGKRSWGGPSLTPLEEQVADMLDWNKIVIVKKPKDIFGMALDGAESSYELVAVDLEDLHDEVVRNANHRLMKKIVAIQQIRVIKGLYDAANGELTNRSAMEGARNLATLETTRRLRNLRARYGDILKKGDVNQLNAWKESFKQAQKYEALLKKVNLAFAVYDFAVDPSLDTGSDLFGAGLLITRNPLLWKVGLSITIGKALWSVLGGGGDSLERMVRLMRFGALCQEFGVKHS